MLEAYIEWPLAGGRRLWTQLMPGAYTDDGSAGRVPWFEVGWHACLGVGGISLLERLHGMFVVGL